MKGENLEANSVPAKERAKYNVGRFWLASTAASDSGLPDKDLQLQSVEELGKPSPVFKFILNLLQ